MVCLLFIKKRREPTPSRLGQSKPHAPIDGNRDRQTDVFGRHTHNDRAAMADYQMGVNIGLGGIKMARHRKACF
jgi:hypothetical protein